MIVAYPLDFRLASCDWARARESTQKGCPGNGQGCHHRRTAENLTTWFDAEAQLHSTSFRIILRHRPNT